METVPSGSVARAVLQFALTGLVAVALLGFVAVQLITPAATRRSRTPSVTELAGEGIVGPRSAPACCSGDPAAIAHWTAVRALLGTTVVRVKIWDAPAESSTPTSRA